MADVKVTFQYPSTRGSGKPFDAGTVKRVEIDLSADGGTSFTKIGDVNPGVFEFTQTELEPGLWVFRGRVIDNKDRAGPYATGSIDTDDTPPGALQDFTVALA